METSQEINVVFFSVKEFNFERFKLGYRELLYMRCCIVIPR